MSDKDLQMSEILISAINGNSNLAITNIEKRGKNNILNKTQLPIYALHINNKIFHNKEDSKELVLKKYREIGINIINIENDLFYNVKLPDGIKLKDKESVYWTYLVNEKGKELASIFYKAVFYDRDAFININW